MEIHSRCGGGDKGRLIQLYNYSFVMQKREKVLKMLLLNSVVFVKVTFTDLNLFFNEQQQVLLPLLRCTHCFVSATALLCDKPFTLATVAIGKREYFNRESS